MIKQLDIEVLPKYILDKEKIYSICVNKLKADPADVKAVIPFRRSIDARSRQPVYRLSVNVYINESPPSENPAINYTPVKSNKRVIIVGSGPAGLFCALRLIELGIKPVIFERGKDVQTRRRDLKAIQQDHIVNPDSNYCFGEGGAGTYSDGKLYTRAVKRGNVKRILQIFVQMGAHQDILVDAHPHIGSNKLPEIIKSMRTVIKKNGGEIYFNSRVTDLIITDKQILGVIINKISEVTGDAVLLAAGHSARDIFYLLHSKGILIEPKPFAMGVRIEHPQKLINEIQYHTKVKDENLPAASYSLNCQVEERGVYSFCMCPGGIIIPSATSPGEIVVNGMSISKRDSPYANSGFVAEVNEKDWNIFNDHFPFAGLKLQEDLEKLSFELGNRSQSAPAQRVTDFVIGKTSASLPPTSYIPGLISVPLHETLPEYISVPLKAALLIFNKKMRGYYTDEAIIAAAESRTSSPIRIPRGKETMMHPEIKGLFPAGEGAGYAGGIVSAAIDGENAAEAIGKYYQ